MQRRSDTVVLAEGLRSCWVWSLARGELPAALNHVMMKLRTSCTCVLRYILASNGANPNRRPACSSLHYSIAFCYTASSMLDTSLLTDLNCYCHCHSTLHHHRSPLRYRRGSRLHHYHYRCPPRHHRSLLPLPPHTWYTSTICAEAPVRSPR
jgi:hypothetical protein